MTLCPVLLAALLSHPGAARAQELRARLLDATSGAPVVGAFASLLEVTGKPGSREEGKPGKVPGRPGAGILQPPVIAGLTDSLGWVQLRARSQGRYTLRVEQLGYRTFTSDTFALDSTTLVRQFPVTVQAIVLPAIAAASKRKCGGADALAAEAAVVWDEVRKALAVTSWTTSEQSVTYFIREYSRRLDPRTLKQLDESSTQQMLRGTGSPFVSLGAQNLSERGFIRMTSEGDYQYYGPDSEVILSPWFQDRHCFRAVVDRDRPQLVGLGFEPGPDAPAYDIEGVLWVDRKTSELRSLEFTYTRVPVPSMDRRQVGGRIDFERLASGRWFVRAWWLRAPVLGPSLGPGAARKLAGLQEIGREVVNVREGK